MSYSMPASDNQGETTGNQFITFDALTAKKLLLTTKELITVGTTTYRRLASFDSREGDVSTFGLSNIMKTDDGEFGERGVAMIDGTHGAALLKNKGTYQSIPFEYTRRAYFSAAGDVVAVGDSPKFAEGGSLLLKADKIPAALDASFKPEAPSAYVAGKCDGTEEDLKIDFESTAHKVCEEPEENFDTASCYDNTVYADGEAASDVTVE